MTTQTPSPAITPHNARVLDVELLALDLTSCTRCTGTLANIEKAIDAVRQVAELTGTALRLRKVVIGSEEEAWRHRFVSSPTVRVGGRDIVFETLESTCGSCSDLCGCSEGTSCRIWRYQGQEHEEAPVGLVVEAVLREIASGPAGGTGDEAAAGPGAVPENLRRFFAGKAAKAAAGQVPAADACCPVAELAELLPAGSEALVLRSSGERLRLRLMETNPMPSLAMASAASSWERLRTELLRFVSFPRGGSGRGRRHRARRVAPGLRPTRGPGATSPSAGLAVPRHPQRDRRSLPGSQAGGRAVRGFRCRGVRWRRSGRPVGRTGPGRMPHASARDATRSLPAGARMGGGRRSLPGGDRPSRRALALRRQVAGAACAEDAARGDPRLLPRRGRPARRRCRVRGPARWYRLLGLQRADSKPGGGDQRRVRLQDVQTESMTGTSTRIPITVAGRPSGPWKRFVRFFLVRAGEGRGESRGGRRAVGFCGAGSERDAPTAPSCSDRPPDRPPTVP